MNILDVARGAYVRSPANVRRALAPLVSLVPTRLKYGSTYTHWRAEIARARSDTAYSTARHLKALRRMLKIAHDRSPFYRELMDEAWGRDFDISEAVPADLRSLPILTKQDLRDAGTATLTAPANTLEKAYTAGSNGEPPFSFMLDRDRSTREMAFVNDAWGRTGFTERDAKIVLRGFGLNPEGGTSRITEWEPALRELRLSVYPMTRSDVRRYLDLIDHHKVRYLYGYPSAIELFCRHMCELQRRPALSMKGILPISEPLHEHQRRTIHSILGSAPVSVFYGMSEKVLFATEAMESPHDYTFDPLYGVAELVDCAGQPITTPGVEGRIIGTALLSTGMPFIRYETNDRASLVELPTPENGQRMVVSRIVPRRKPDYLISRSGNRVVMIDFTPDSPRFFKGVAEYQFLQERPGEVTIRYIPSADGTEQDALNIAANLGRRTEGEIRFAVKRVDRIVGGRVGKRAFIDQRLDVSAY